MSNNTWEGKHGPLLIAEIGGNHLGDFEYAKKLTDLAIQSDVDYIKFQLYQGDTLVSKVENPARNQHYKKFELSKDQHIFLAEMCKAHQVGYMASVWDPRFLEWIDPYIDIYKIGSGDLTAYPILKAVAKQGKPIILSTGLSTLEEVRGSIWYLQSLNPIYEGENYLSLLQCTTMYPISASDANLEAIRTLNLETDLPVGYSDHTEGMDALTYAIAMGAQILEFHFTDTRRGQTFRDHKVSLTRNEVLKLQEKIKLIQSLKGDGIKKPLPVEEENRIFFRRAIYPSVDIKKGGELTEENLICLRPNHGIDARDYERVLNMRTKKSLKAYQKLDWEMLYEQ